MLASRTRAKLALVVAALAARFPAVRVRPVVLDLADGASVRRGAGEIAGWVGREGGGRVDVLFDNAGVNGGGRVVTGGFGGEGVEVVFATNHLGPFLLTGLLMPLVREGGRVVLTSSEAHRISPVRFGD